MPDIALILIGAAAGGLVFGIIAYILGIQYRKRKAEGILGSAEEEAKRLLNDAIKNAEAKKKETLLEAKDEIHRLRTEADKENRERRSEIQRQDSSYVKPTVNSGEERGTSSKEIQRGG